MDTSYGASSIKNQCIGLLQAVQWLRGRALIGEQFMLLVPLIFLNSLFILLDVIIG